MSCAGPAGPAGGAVGRIVYGGSGSPRSRGQARPLTVIPLVTGGLAGSPAQVVEKIGRYREIGASRVYLQILDLHDLDHLELISSQALGKLS